MTGSRRMPSDAQIVEYWEGHEKICTHDLNGHPACFACQSWLKHEKAHILAKAEGGSDTVDNLHILCRSCHDESEWLSGELYWQWLIVKNTSQPYWIRRWEELWKESHQQDNWYVDSFILDKLNTLRVARDLPPHSMESIMDGTWQLTP